MHEQTLSIKAFKIFRTLKMYTDETEFSIKLYFFTSKRVKVILYKYLSRWLLNYSRTLSKTHTTVHPPKPNSTHKKILKYITYRRSQNIKFKLFNTFKSLTNSQVSLIDSCKFNQKQLDSHFEQLEKSISIQESSFRFSHENPYTEKVVTPRGTHSSTLAPFSRNSAVLNSLNQPEPETRSRISETLNRVQDYDLVQDIHNRLNKLELRLNKRPGY